MRPETSRQLAMLITFAGVVFVFRSLDPEGWKPFGALLKYWWVILPAWIAYAIVDHFLLEWFGKRTSDGTPEQYEDPIQRRLDRIEAAINRLHEYVQDLDSDLVEEDRLWREFMSGDGGMFAGMNHMEYVRDREKRGLRTRHTSIWSDTESA